MPKEESHLPFLRKKMMTKRSKQSLVQPANVDWQIIGSGARGGPKSLLLHTDHRRYLFNCGESTQRLTCQLNLAGRLGQLEHVLITSKSWKNLGGLPGLCLSARNTGAPNVTIHGPTGCMELYEATKNFVLLFGFDVLRHRVEDGVYSDSAVEVTSVPLARSEPSLAPAVPCEWFGLNDEDRVAGAIKYDNTAVAYICYFAPKPGKLDLAACLERGVTPGPLLGQLKAGRDVVLGDGTTVSAADVVGQAAEPTRYLVLELPDIHYLDSLEAAEQLRSIKELQVVFHMSPRSVVRKPRYRAWMAALGPAIRHVMLSEDSTGLGLPDVSAYHHKLRIIRPDLFPGLQGAGDHDLTDEKELTEKLFVPSDTMEEGTGPVVQAKSGLKINVRGSKLSSKLMDAGNVLPFVPSVCTKELLEGCAKLTDDDERNEYKEAMLKDLEYARTFAPVLHAPGADISSKLKVIDGKDDIEDAKRRRLNKDLMDSLKQQYGVEETVKEPSSSSNSSSYKLPCKLLGSSPEPSSTKFPVVTFLGTGSSVPSKYKNVSCILVETEPESWIMLDCGEGSFSQMVRLYGWDRARQVIRGLKAVYISHMHADHHLGMISIIQHREAAFKDLGLPVSSLYILATKKLGSFLTYYHTKLEPILCHAEFIHCEHFVSYEDVNIPGKKVQLIYEDRLSALLKDVGLRSIVTSKAIHCPHAFCLSFTTRDGFKLAYSGDTRPNPEFRDIALEGGVGPDLLIHEATMEHFMLNDAKIKKHSTFTEAIEEGLAMQAKFTILTHFSQRYAKMPPLEEIEGKANVGIAFDYMTVTPDLFAFIPSLYPAMVRWLWEHIRDMEVRGDQYKHKFSDDGLDMGDDVESPLAAQERLVEKLEKRWRDKEEGFKAINRRKAMALAKGIKMPTAETREAWERNRRMSPTSSPTS